MVDDFFLRPLSTAPRKSDSGTATETVGVVSSIGGIPPKKDWAYEPTENLRGSDTVGPIEGARFSGEDGRGMGVGGGRGRMREGWRLGEVVVGNGMEARRAEVGAEETREAEVEGVMRGRENFGNLWSDSSRSTVELVQVCLGGWVTKKCGNVEAIQVSVN